jgi:hypothetical protein
MPLLHLAVLPREAICFLCPSQSGSCESFTMDNGLFDALFPFGWQIVERNNEDAASMEYLRGRIVLNGSGNYLGRS